MPDTHQHLADEIQANLDQISTILAALDAGIDVVDESGYRQDAAEDLDELPVEIGTHRKMTIALTVGGPSVHLEGDLDSDGDVTGARIVGHLGTEQIVRWLSPEGSAYRAVQHYAEGLTH